MSAIQMAPNASGTGTLSIASPNTNTNRTLTLPDATVTLVGDTNTQTLTNKTLGSGYGGGAVISGTATASTSGTSIDFSSIPSWVKQITINFNTVSLSSTGLLLVQLGTAGGIDATSYSGLGMYITSGPGLTTNSTGFLINNVGTAAQLISGSLVLCLLNSSTNLWTASGTFVGTGTYNQTAYSGGTKTLSGVLTTVRITSSTGTDTFDNGSLNILYQ